MASLIAWDSYKNTFSIVFFEVWTFNFGGNLRSEWIQRSWCQRFLENWHLSFTLIVFPAPLPFLSSIYQRLMISPLCIEESRHAPEWVSFVGCGIEQKGLECFALGDGSVLGAESLG